MENGENMLSHDKRSQLLLCQTVKDSSPSTDQATCLRGHAMKKKKINKSQTHGCFQFNTLFRSLEWKRYNVM